MAFKMKNTSMAKLAKEAGDNRISPIKAKEKFKVKKYDLFLSISDEKDYSIAFTIIQKQ